LLDKRAGALDGGGWGKARLNFWTVASPIENAHALSRQRRLETPTFRKWVSEAPLAIAGTSILIRRVCRPFSELGSHSLL
jgi:hypothetical protein